MSLGGIILGSNHTDVGARLFTLMQCTISGTIVLSDFTDEVETAQNAFSSYRLFDMQFGGGMHNHA